MQPDEANVVEMSRGTVEYVLGRWYSNVTLDAQPVEVQVRPLDWQDAVWEGSPGETRDLRSVDPLDFATLAVGLHDVYGRFADNVETPLVRLGAYRVTG